MRRKDREITDLHQIESIVMRCKTLRLAMCEGDMPYVVPMNFGYAFDGERFSFCLHSAKEGKKLEILRANPNVAFEMDVENGLVEGPAACNYGCLYESVIGRGTIRFAEGPEEKKALLKRLMRQQTGREFDFTDPQVSAVEVLFVEVTELTAKARMPRQAGA